MTWKLIYLSLPHPVPNFHLPQSSSQLCQVQLLPYSLDGKQAQGTNIRWISNYDEEKHSFYLFARFYSYTTVNDRRDPKRAGANFNGKSFDTDPARTNALTLSQICWINRAILVWVWHAHFYWDLVWQESGVFKERLYQHLLVEDTRSLRNEGIILPTKYRWNDNTLRLKIV